jgi:hypothetical protein
VGNVKQQDCRDPCPVWRTSIESAGLQAHRYQQQRNDRATQEYTQIDISREKP